MTEKEHVCPERLYRFVKPGSLEFDVSVYNETVIDSVWAVIWNDVVGSSVLTSEFLSYVGGVWVGSILVNDSIMGKHFDVYTCKSFSRKTNHFTIPNKGPRDTPIFIG